MHAVWTHMFSGSHYCNHCLMHKKSMANMQPCISVDTSRFAKISGAFGNRQSTSSWSIDPRSGKGMLTKWTHARLGCKALLCLCMRVNEYMYIYNIYCIQYMYILFPTSSRLELEWLQVMHACTDMSWLLGHAQINANPCVHQRSGPSIMASVAHSAMYLHSKIMNLKLFSCMDADEKVYVHVHGFRTCMVMNALPRMHGRKSIFFHCWGRSQYCLVKTVRGTFDFGSGGTSSCKQHDMQASVHGTCTHQSMEHACFEYIRWAIRALHFSWRGWFHISGLTTHQQ